jgi:lipopolysaccharide transport system permease protein
MIVFTVVFGKLAQMPSGGIPYPVLVYAAMLPWQFFASGLSEGSNSLVVNANMVSKIYFPRIIVPASAVIVSFVDFLISAIILGGLMAWYAVLPTWRLLTLPLFILLALIASLGASLWLAALNVKYRDFRYVIPFIVQFGLYLSPVGFSSDVVRQKFGETAYQIYSLNPMVGVIEGFRWAINGDPNAVLDGRCLLFSALVGGLILVLGLRYFRATEETFADVI